MWIIHIYGNVLFNYSIGLNTLEKSHDALKGIFSEDSSTSMVTQFFKDLIKLFEQMMTMLETRRHRQSLLLKKLVSISFL